MIEVGTILGIVSIVIALCMGMHYTLSSDCLGIHFSASTNTANDVLDVQIEKTELELTKDGKVLFDKTPVELS